MKKKIIYNEKTNFFFFGAEILKGYYPVCIVREKEKKIVLQYSFVLQRMKLVDAWVVLQ